MNSSFVIARLSNGKRVGNFSSPHDFQFTDGTFLEAVEPHVSKTLAVKFIEKDISGKGDISLSFELTPEITTAIYHWSNYAQAKLVDVVFCPLPMIQALKEVYGLDWLLKSPFRSIRIEDRLLKLVSIDKQCI